MKYSFIALLLLLLNACNQQDSAPAAADIVRPVAMAKMSADSASGAQQRLMSPEFSRQELSQSELNPPSTSESNNSAQPAAQKYIALRHHLQIETAPEKMQASFDAAIKQCETLNCQLLSANFNRQTPYNPPSASLSLRMPPKNVSLFLTGLTNNGEVTQHSRDSEDKTNQVIDADARIKNLTDLRDRLRLMLGDKLAKFKDIIDVERELANTQSQLDSIASIRKVLALETDLVAVNIDFSASQGITEQGFCTRGTRI